MKKILSWLRWTVLYTLTIACVEEVSFDVPAPELLTIIEGRITNQIGGYSINISKGLSLDSDTTANSGVTGASATLFDDLGNSEHFIEFAPGRYKTTGTIQGKIGHSYFVRVTMPDGDVYESEPDTLYAGGEIIAINYEFESRTMQVPWGTTDVSVFNIFIDAQAPNTPESYIRWKYTGTFKVETFPELYMTWNPPYTPYKDPRPCSGYIVVPGPEGSGGLLKKIADCTCCTCWINNYEQAPQLADNQLIQNGSFKRVKVGEVPLLREAFEDKYQVVVEQSALTRNAFNFFSLIRNQKINASNIFQPPSGELIGNFKSTNSNNRVVGIFWAGSTNIQSIFLSKNDLPYPIPPLPLDSKLDACYTLFPGATTQKPPLWD
jgi:hypothetical protein